MAIRPHPPVALHQAASSPGLALDQSWLGSRVVGARASWAATVALAAVPVSALALADGGYYPRPWGWATLGLSLTAVVVLSLGRSLTVSVRALVLFGATDRDALADPATGVRLPTLLFGVAGFPQGIPTADVSGLGNFCTVEASPSPGYQFLVRFRSTATGNIIVTVRVKDVEQVFCTSKAGGAITFADLTVADPTFVEVPLADVAALNPIAAQSIR